MKTDLERVYKYIDAHAQDFVQNLIKLIRQPSTSATSEGIEECSVLVEKMMNEVGFSTKILQGEKGNPVVFGEMKSEISDKTLLFYDHYDTQPPALSKDGSATHSVVK